MEHTGTDQAETPAQTALAGRIRAWQAEWMETMRHPAPATQAESDAMHLAHSRLLGVAYVLLFDVQHDTDTSAEAVELLQRQGYPYRAQPSQTPVYDAARGPFEPIGDADPAGAAR